MLHVTIRTVVTSVIVGWMESLGDGAATSLPIVSTISTATTVSQGERESEHWKSRSSTTETDQQELAKHTRPNQKHLKTK